MWMSRSVQRSADRLHKMMCQLCEINDALDTSLHS